MAKVKETSLVNDIVTLTFILQALVLKMNGSEDPVNPVLMFMNRWSELRGLRYITNLNITQRTTDFKTLIAILNPEIAYVINSMVGEDKDVLVKAFTQNLNTENEV